MSDLLTRCVTILQQRHVEAYLVGGTVRDQLLGRTSHDLDFVVPHDALGIARMIANQVGGAFYPLDTEREAGRVVMPDRVMIDIALMRGADIRADLATRDFTINAMARPISNLDELIDPQRGADDLRACLIRAVSEQSFRTDPVRLTRAVRLAATFGFTIEPQTREWLQRDAALLTDASGERVRDELVKILEQPHSIAPLSALQTCGLLPLVLPHAQWNDIVQSALQQLEEFFVAGSAHVAQRLVELLRAHAVEITNSEHMRALFLKLAVLYEDAAQCAADLNALKFSRHEIDYARALVRHRARFAQLPVPVDALATHRFYRDAGSAALGLITIAASQESDAITKTATALLESYADAYEHVIAPAPILNGAELAEQFGLRGPHIGEALVALVEAQVNGIVRSREDAEKFIGYWILDTNDPNIEYPISNI